MVYSMGYRNLIGIQRAVYRPRDDVPKPEEAQANRESKRVTQEESPSLM
jgi:hypothetical protein